MDKYQKWCFPQKVYAMHKKKDVDKTYYSVV